jgi:thiol:disulfide interchange protein DsbD
VVFEIDPGWHIYSPWRSDTGLPLLVQPAAPDGYRFAEPLWPAPHRLVDEAGILDHIYEKQVVVLLPLEVPPDARSGSAVTLTCRVDWLVCGDGCIPGQGDLRITLPVERLTSAPLASSESPRIQAALRQVPVPQDQLTREASLNWDRDAWEVTVPGATSLVFYPDSACAALLDPIADGLANASRLRLRVQPGEGDAPISGILEVVSARGSGFYRIDSARPEHGGGVPPSRT